MKDRRVLTGVYELARAKLKEMGAVGGDQLRTRTGVIKLVEALIGPCRDGDELKFLNSFINRGTVPCRTPIIKGEYKLSAEMKQAEKKAQIQPRLIAMASNLAFTRKDQL